MRIIKEPFSNEDKRLPPKLLYVMENMGTGNSFIHFTNYRTNGYELHLKQGDRKVATLIMREKEMEEFKKLFEKVRGE